MRARGRSGATLVPLLVMCCWAPRVHAWSQDSTFNLPQALDRYEQGNAPAPGELAALAAMAADGRLIASLRSSGWDWLQEGGPAGLRGRRLSLAALVLEVTSAQFDTTGLVSRDVIEWACANLRESDPLPAERAWQIATVTFMQRGASKNDFDVHLTHALRRFKNEPRLLLADAWLQRSWIPDHFQHDPMASTNPYFPYGPNIPSGPAVTGPMLVIFPSGTVTENGPSDFGFSTRQNNQYWDTITQPVGFGLHKASPGELPYVAAQDDYRRARGTAAVAAEAELRLGELDLLYAKPTNAFDHFAAALTRTSDPNLQYLAYFLMGESEARQSLWSAACVYYNKALHANPNGRSVIDAWAWVLDKEGLPAEAAAMRARVTDPAAADPWIAFSKGDLVPLSSLVEEMRKAVR